MKKAIIILLIIFISFACSCSSSKNLKYNNSENTPLAPINSNTDKVSNNNDSSNIKSNENITSNLQNTDSTGDNSTTVSNNTDTDLKESKATLVQNISNEKIVYWQPGRNTEHKVPVMKSAYKSLLDKYGGYFVGNTTEKVIYLTFDEGYENGFSQKILDILKVNNVKAAFFVTKPYIKANIELTKRMVSEGHLVCNHSVNHLSMPDLSDEKMEYEIIETQNYFKEITGTEMPKFFRPPMGEWSEKSLYIANSLGYKTILWSIAHNDWDPNNQPGREAALNLLKTYYHNGAILLLHAVSQSNTEALDDIIKAMKDNGYRFATLDELK